MNKKTFKNSMEGKRITTLDFILREHVLQGIIFDLKDALKYYAESDIYWDSPNIDFEPGGKIAADILKQYDKSFDELYAEKEKEMKEFEKNAKL